MPSLLSDAQLTQIRRRAHVRITTLVNRGADICPAFDVPIEGGVSCVVCGYQSDVHLVRDLLALVDQLSQEHRELERAVTQGAREQRRLEKLADDANTEVLNVCLMVETFKSDASTRQAAIHERIEHYRRSEEACSRLRRALEEAAGRYEGQQRFLLEKGYVPQQFFDESMAMVERWSVLALPAGWVDGVLYCYGGCGRRYEDFPLDVILPTPLWNRIAVGPPFDETQQNIEREGRGGTLCAACIVERLAKLPGVSVAFLSVARDLYQSIGNLVPMHDMRGLSQDQRRLYKAGFCDARYLAAELAAAPDATRAASSESHDVGREFGPSVPNGGTSGQLRQEEAALSVRDDGRKEEKTEEKTT